MTPPASAAARPLTPERRRRVKPASGRPPSRRPPRRYSGPARGVASAAAAVAAPAPALPRRRPPAPTRAPRSRDARSIPLRSLQAAVLLLPQRLLERSLRGRAWIAVLAIGLVGLVSAQLVVLRLNTSIGRSLARAAELQRENATIAIENSEADAGETIEGRARALGMTLLSPGDLQFRHIAGIGKAGAAAQALRSTKASSPSESSSAATTGAEAASTTPTGAESASSAPSGTEAASTTPTGEVAGSAPTGTEATSTAPTGEATSLTSTSGETAPVAPSEESQASSTQAGAASAPAGVGG